MENNVSHHMCQAMIEQIRFLEDELFQRAYKDIERLEIANEELQADNRQLRARCVNLLSEIMDYEWERMVTSRSAPRSHLRKWRSKNR